MWRRERERGYGGGLEYRNERKLFLREEIHWENVARGSAKYIRNYGRV